MDRKLLNRLGQEMDIVCRLRQLKPEDLVRELIEWLDYTFHGVVPMPCDVPEDRP